MDDAVRGRLRAITERYLSGNAGAHQMDHTLRDDPFAEKRALDDNRYTLDHFFRKLFKLPELMHTQPARLLAEERAQFMHEYLRVLANEIGVIVPAQQMA